MKELTPQQEWVRDFVLNANYITNEQAYIHGGVQSLKSVICALRKAGYEFYTVENGYEMKPCRQWRKHYGFFARVSSWLKM